tara:strand:- start:337 stop:564 length:228 start_codon:yes stop_codon:yes gene_type:complete
MNDKKEDSADFKSKAYSDTMYAYKKAIENIIKKGLVPGSALRRMNELRLDRIRTIQFHKSMKKLADATNGQANKS